MDARVLLGPRPGRRARVLLVAGFPLRFVDTDPAVAFFFFDDAAAALLPPVLAALDFSLSTRASIVAPISLR